MVEDREPGGVAVHALDDAMLVEDALEAEAERTAAAREAALRALHFHSIRR